MRKPHNTITTLILVLLSWSLKGFAQDTAHSNAQGEVLDYLPASGQEIVQDSSQKAAQDSIVGATAGSSSENFDDSNLHFSCLIPPKGHPGCPICTMDVTVKTNGLYDALLVPSVGLEFSFGPHWSIALDYVGSWWSSNRRHRYWQCYGGYVTLRRWFSDYHLLRRGEGKGVHHVGAYMTALTYDVELGGRGYQAARFGFGAGAEYGYTLPIGKRLTLDFTIGVGFQDGEYKEYDPTHDGTGHYVWQATKKRHWFGPTKAEITLAWLLWKGGGK